MENPQPAAAQAPDPADEILADTSARRWIFVLGDSRTGTLSLHNFFVRNGIRSIHHFVADAGLREPLHENEEYNSARFANFIASSGCDAFSDYPTRYYYKYLYEKFPNALFILTTRRSTDRWETSMREFFSKFSIVLDYSELRAAHEYLNGEIQMLFSNGSRRFLELCIDDDNVVNSGRLSAFLNLPGFGLLGNDNASAGIDLDKLSGHYRLYSDLGDATADGIEKRLHPSKSMLSEYGWAFLVNDGNDFLKIQMGYVKWSDEDSDTAKRTLQERKALLADRNVKYYKFIIPEKSIVYPEFLPRAIQSNIRLEMRRPAVVLAEGLADFVFYLDSYLQDAKSYGLSYFRGDTHTNWLGAWLVYRYIITKIEQIGLIPGTAPISYADLHPSVAGYVGDLVAQTDPDLRAEFDRVWGFIAPGKPFELTIKLELKPPLRVATQLPTPPEYSEWFNSRETLVFERGDGVGLRAVVFRDSTLDFSCELFAQHFSRSVFVWHNGHVFDEILEIEKPDVVIHVMAERFVARYTSFPALAHVEKADPDPT